MRISFEKFHVRRLQMQILLLLLLLLLLLISLLVKHVSDPVEGISNEIIARYRIYQLFSLKSEDFTVGFVHFIEHF